MRFRKIEYGILGFGILLAAAAFLIDSPKTIFSGLIKIILTDDTLITDYIALVGVGAAFLNAGLVLICSTVILLLSRNVTNGFSLAESSLMLGFALFGKNIANIWPMIIGTFLYAKYMKESFSKYVGVALLATSLSPMVSFICLHQHNPVNLIVGILCGILIGFLLPPLSAFTFKIQNGMNLYNMGFACGILAMILVPICRRLGLEPTPANHWATGYNLWFAIALAAICLSLILIGTFGYQHKPRQAWEKYWHMLRSSGRAPSDYIRTFEESPVFISMGINGILATAYILIIGGDLNGPTLGGIITIMGFSACGKHAFNILPVMIGVVIGDALMFSRINEPTMQLAGLFCTGLAPIAGYFGWPYGILAGVLHSAVIYFAGSPITGMNLYNNGFSAGIIAIVLYPIIVSVARHKKFALQDKDYFEVFTHEEPIKEEDLGDDMNPTFHHHDGTHHHHDVAQ